MQPDIADTIAFLRRREALQLQRQQAESVRLRGAVASALQAFRQRRGAFDAWLIGSLAWGHADDASDVDVVVAGLPEALQAALWRDLEQATGRAVDLLDLGWLSADFAQRVRAEGVPL